MDNARWLLAAYRGPHDIDRRLFMDAVGVNPLSGMCFLLVSREATTEKKKASKKIGMEVRSKTRLFVVRVHSVLDAAPCFWDACRGYVCDFTPLTGDCRYTRHMVSLWHTFLTGHTFSSHKSALFRAETEILTRPPLKVYVSARSRPANAQSALVFGFPQNVWLSAHSSRLCLANGRSSEELWHDHTYHRRYPPPTYNSNPPSSQV